MKKKSVTSRIIIVDDDERLRAQLVRTVNRFGDCECIAQFASGEAALDGIPPARPDVVLMDINMPGMSGIDCVQRLKAAHPEIEFIMLTVYQDTERIFNSLKAGASGYILKRAVGEELRDAIQQVRAGGSPMTGQIARRVVQAFQQPAVAENVTARLSPREQEVLELLAKGHLYKEIASSLGITYATVHNYIRRMYEKLQVSSRAEAAAKFFSNQPAITPAKRG